ncbi:hypothetical protein BHYA_0290g00020 [Botrytis hyacinthi]|uniref:Uncharacterized protein n=1 Tax=Botrytis hyacinthi TaxID=278943 RepID=A0A4Z1GFJ2_9HELO|nr:hypothetical protein BHYA_0290g00020 [Botrytis hyacinthi]
MASEYAAAGERYNGENSRLTDGDDDDEMARAVDIIEDELGGKDKDEGPNPGDKVLWFGEYKWHKYDELSLSYIERMVNKYLENPATASSDIKDFKVLYDRKQVRGKENASELSPPGQTIMWFGKYEGTAFDKLKDGYVMWHINNYHKDGDRADSNTRKVKELYDRHNSWLVAKGMRTWKSPGSIPIWFGKDKGSEFRKIYKSQPQKWSWLLENTRWAPILKAIAREFDEWLLKNPPRQQSASRNRPVIVNPVGERLGPDDDGVASDDGSYISDGSFVVPDEDESSDEDGSSDERETGESETDEEVDESTTTEDCEVDKNKSPNLDGSESDTLEEALPGTPSVPRSSKRQPLGISDDFTSLSDSGDGSEAIVSPGKRRMTRNLFSPRKRTKATIEGSGKWYLERPVTQKTSFDHEPRDITHPSSNTTRNQEGDSSISSPGDPLLLPNESTKR